MAPYGLALVAMILVANAGCAARRHAAKHVPKDPPDASLLDPRNAIDPLPPRFRARALEDARDAGLLGNTAGTWTSVGPYNRGGRVSALARDPNASNVLWLGAADGGVFKSVDGGVQWTPVFDAQTALSIGAIAIHPTNSSIVYVGTGEENGLTYSYDGEGMFKTVDGGATWQSLGLAETRHIGKLAIDPADPQRVFVAAGGGVFVKDIHRGVYRSVDGGDTWTKVLYIADDSGAADVAIDPSNSTRVFATIWQRSKAGNNGYYGGANSGIYRSTDSGSTWTRLTSGLPSGSNVGRIGIAIAPSTPQTVYAVIYAGTGELLGIYRSTNGGDSWSKRSSSGLPSSFATYGHYFGQIRVDPVNAATVYALDVSTWKSTDGASNFAMFPGVSGTDGHDLIVGPGAQLLYGTDGGFHSSTDGGMSFTTATTLPITQLYGLCISRQNPLRRFAGAQDHGIVRTTTGGLNWSTVISGDGMQCQIDPTNFNKVYAENQYGNFLRSTNGGTGWTNSFTGIDLSERANWNTPLVLDPTVPTKLYMGYQKVYRSIDSMVTWSAISPDLTNGPTLAAAPANPVNGTITAVAASPVDPNVIWAGTDDGNVWVTSNGGANWTKRNPPGTPYWVTAIAPDTFEAGKAFLTVTGYRAGVSTPYLRVTSDLGVNWQSLSAGLPQVPLDDVVPDPEWEGRMYVASDVGVHVSVDAGTTWNFLGTGMPSVVVMKLALDPPTRTLYAGTYGRSVYAFDLNQLPQPDGDEDGVDDHTDCAPSDPGAFAIPGEIGPLALVKSGTDALISWPVAASGTGTVYDVARGVLSALQSTGTAGAGALICALGATGTTDTLVPAAGDGAYYLARARNACGIGTWGTNSAGSPRVVGACP